MRRLLVAVCLLAACGKVEKIEPDAFFTTDILPTLRSLDVAPDPVTVNVGGQVQLMATGTYSDESVVDVTPLVTWSATPTGGMASVTSGLVIGSQPGTVVITAELDGKVATADITVRRSSLVVANYSGKSISVFDSTASGDVAPLRTISGALTTLASPRGVWVVNDEIIVADQGASAITTFPLTANGNVAPTRRIAGMLTTLVSPDGLLVRGTELYVGAGNKVLVFPLTGTGDIAPTRTMTGFSTAEYLAVNGNELFVVDYTDHSVKVVAVDGTGAVTPLRTIKGAATGLDSGPSGIVVHGNEVYVSDTRPAGTGTTGNEIHVFPLTANGDVAPTRTIAGASTGLGYPDQMVIVDDDLYVANFDTKAIRVFPLTANGDAVPARSIVGAATGFNGTTGVFVY